MSTKLSRVQLRIALQSLLLLAIAIAFVNPQPIGSYYGSYGSPYGAYGGSQFGSFGSSPFSGPGFGNSFGASPFASSAYGSLGNSYGLGGGGYNSFSPFDSSSSFSMLPMSPYSNSPPYMGGGGFGSPSMFPGSMNGFGGGPFGAGGGGFGSMNYMNTLQNKENFQASGCAWDALTNRCNDALNLCKGGCHDFNIGGFGGGFGGSYGGLASSSPLAHDCRCIPIGFSNMIGKKK